MRFDWSTLALQTVNFAVLVWLLQRFLYRPVLRVIDTRRAEVEKQYSEAKSAEAEARGRLMAVDAERAKLAGERDAILKGAVARAEEAAKTRAAQAERDAGALLAETRKTLESEREAALARSKRMALDLGIEVARRLLAEAPAAVRTEAWLEPVERHLSTLPKEELDGLRRQLADGAGLRVVTASPLPEKVADSWSARLRHAVGDSVAVSFEADPGLIAGAELHFPTAVLRFSWRNALSALHAEIDGHGDTR